MKKEFKPYPEWAIKHRRPGIEIRRVKENFYVYEVSSFYDKEKKKGRKKTGAYLGKITEKEGFIPTNSKKVDKSIKTIDRSTISTKEYGLSAFIQSYCSEIVDLLKQHFPDNWEHILVGLFARLAHTSPLKNIEYYFKRSFLSEQFEIKVTSKIMSDLLRKLGINRTPIIEYMKSFFGEGVVLIDATSIISYSRNLSRVYTNLSKKGTYEPLFNLLYFYSPSTYLPAYYRLFNGNIKDVKMISIAIKESEYKNALVIADKGFYSDENLEILEQEDLKYIIPLKRNSTLINNDSLKGLTQSPNVFLFENRPIYFTSYDYPLEDKEKNRKKRKNAKVKQVNPKLTERRIYLFIDEAMMLQEKRDFIHRMETSPNNYTKELFQEKMDDFGSFAVISNKEDTPQNVFQNYKSRVGIEVLFDAAKNILGNDHTYMQNNDALEGWMFLNHLALQVHHKIYAILKEQNLISKYSIRDFIERLLDIKRVRINNEWILEPLIKDQQVLLKKMGIDIT
ncbi:MAG: IS1634 family transposase [Rhabdochlamydiaceae bacterium]